jgi:hypothetical protein
MTKAIVSFTSLGSDTWYLFWRHFAQKWWHLVDQWIVIDNGIAIASHLLPRNTRTVICRNADVGKMALEYAPKEGKLLMISEATLAYDPKVIEDALKRDGITSACDKSGKFAIVSEQPILAVAPAEWLDRDYPDLSLSLAAAYDKYPHHGLQLDTSYATLYTKRATPTVIKNPTGFYFVPNHIEGEVLINRFDPATVSADPVKSSDLSVSEWRSLMWHYLACVQASKGVQPIIEMVEAYMPITRWVNYHRRHLQAHPWLKPTPIALKP